jgi:two-component system, OmpR family, phosphate regulon sensor histidine kinase PhoR
MNSSLLRRLLFAAFALILATLFVLNHALSEVDADVRARALGIDLAAALFAIAVALLVSRSLTTRVRGLKRAAENLLGSEARPAALADSGDDLGSLERSLDSVGQELRGLVSNLRFESARREAILAGMGEGVLAVDPDLKVTFCNQSLLRATGYRGEVAEGMGVLEVVRDPALYGAIRSVRSSGDSVKLRFVLTTETPRTFEVGVRPMVTASGRGVIAIFHDITGLERLEQVRKDFVANVSHELRTPLAGIIGYADTLLDGALEDTQNRQRFVEIIRSSAVRLSNLVADLLVLAELESGAEPQEPEIVPVCGVLETVLLTVDAEAKARGVSLVREEMQDLRVAGRRLRLEQAVLNLVANAIKFNRPGGEVRVRVVLTADGRMAISVADTGPGIPSQDLPRIFERFYRVDRARSRDVGGTGLGLSIVKHIVEGMGGLVTVESQLGTGATFTILLPAANPAD